jgi:iron-sulfur cluster assembly protein
MDQPGTQTGIHGDATVKREESPEAAKKDGKQLKIDVTPSAVAQIRKLFDKRKAEGKAAVGLRIGLRGGGCDGFSYVFEWADKPADPKRDHVLEFGSDGDAVNVFIDRKSMLYLAGTTLNFVTGLMGHGFKFENPNVKGSCGCGESVQF